MIIRHKALKQETAIPPIHEIKLKRIENFLNIHCHETVVKHTLTWMIIVWYDPLQLNKIMPIKTHKMVTF